MPRSFELTLPETDVSLLAELTRVLGDQGQIFEAEEDWRSLQAMKLIVELGSGGTGAILGTVEVAKLLIKLRDRIRAAFQDRPLASQSRIRVLEEGAEIGLVDASDEQLQALAEESLREVR